MEAVHVGNSPLFFWMQKILTGIDLLLCLSQLFLALRYKTRSKIGFLHPKQWASSVYKHIFRPPVNERRNKNNVKDANKKNIPFSLQFNIVLV